MDDNLIDELLKEDIPEWEYDEFKMNKETENTNYNGDNLSILTDGDDDETSSKINESLNQSAITASSLNEVMSVSSTHGTPVVSPQSQRRSNHVTTLIQHKTGRIIKHAILTKVANQMSLNKGKINIGSATCCTRGKYLAIGTSKGLTFIFDLKQVLRFYVGSQDKGEQYGAVSSISFNVDCSRLLVAFAKAHINMWDISGNEGKLLRSIDVNQGPGYAVSFVRFLPDPTMAVYVDTNGSVFQLSFKRGIAGRSTDLECFFSGCRGEILCLEPLFLPKKMTKHAIGGHCLLAMASFTKVIVVSSRPQLKVKYMYNLPGRPETMPHLAWSLNSGFDDSNETVLPDVFLTFARDNHVYILKITCAQKRPGIELSPDTSIRDLQFEIVFSMQLDVQILSMKWLNQYFLAILDFEEQFHAIDMQTKLTVEILDLKSVKLVYNTSLFKSTATGGNVSEAMAMVAEKACYHSVVEQNGQIKILGHQDIHLLMLRPWIEAVEVIYGNHSAEKAFQMCSELYKGSNLRSRQVLMLPRDKEERRKIVTKFSLNLIETSLKDNLERRDLHSFFNTMLDLCVVINQIDYYTSTVYYMLAKFSEAEVAFIRSIVPLILNNQVTELHPELVQRMVEYLLTSGQTVQLDCCISKLLISCIDLDQIIKMSKKYHLFSALIHVYNGAFNDYLTPIKAIIDFISDTEFSGLDHEIQSEAVIRAIVYIHCCFSGKDYFTGKPLPQEMSEQVKSDMFEYLVPFEDRLILIPLGVLLQNNTNELLNMLTLAFDEDLFTTDVGISRKQATIQKLCTYFTSNSLDTSKQDTIRFFVFLSRELTKTTNISLFIEQRVLDELFEKVCLGIDDMLNSKKENNLSFQFFQQKQVEMAFMNFLKIGSPYRQYWLESEHVLTLSKRAQLYKICECIYREKKMLHMVLECFLLDQEYRNEAFDLIESAWNDDDVDEGQRSEILKKCFQLCEELIVTNPVLSVVVLLIVAKKRVEEVMEKLPEDSHESKFHFLKSFFLIRHEMEEKEVGNEGNTEVSPSISASIKAIKVHAPIAELFVDLLCRFEPDNLPIYLKYSVDYRPDYAIKIVANYDIPYSMGFLYEKVRNFNDACDIYIKTFNKLWIQCVNGGELNEDSSFISSPIGRSCQLCINRFVSLIKKYKVHNSDAEKLWIKMLNCILDKKVSSKEKQYDFMMKAIFTHFVKSLSNEIPMPVVLITILKSQAFVGENFGKIRDLMIFMMNSFNYEKLLLESCISMVNDDVTDCIMQLRTVLGSGVVVSDLRCCLCNENICHSEFRNHGCIYTFRCGHRFHQLCLRSSKKASGDSLELSDEMQCSLCSKSALQASVPRASIAQAKPKCDGTLKKAPDPSILAQTCNRDLSSPNSPAMTERRRAQILGSNNFQMKDDVNNRPIKLKLSPPNYLLNFVNK